MREVKKHHFSPSFLTYFVILALMCSFEKRLLTIAELKFSISLPAGMRKPRSVFLTIHCMLMSAFVLVRMPQVESTRT